MVFSAGQKNPGFCERHRKPLFTADQKNQAFCNRSKNPSFFVGHKKHPPSVDHKMPASSQAVKTQHFPGA
jgi:hypothetical protein